ncbi:5-dehydro-4-deoxyglucarate dehydratase [Halobacillus andaensis]|uniref:5-dehydro-4-deoxyglucarate dehydratase n=1 Tax=Halobacillus andaensis TaxID=1176239 RepID=UPI003D709B69
MERKAPAGILGFPVSPFTRENTLDENALAKNIEFLIDEGLDAIFVACGAGEFNSLNRQEYEESVQLAVSVVKGRVPVYTGVGGVISEALEQSKISERLGADGYLILPPYLVDSEQDGLYEYYRVLAQSTSLNTIVYQRGNAVLQLQTLKRLLDIPQVVGLKDGLGNMEMNIEFTQTIGCRLGWLNGMPMAEVTMPSYRPLGYNSYSSAISNYIPHISRMFYNSLINGDKETVHALFQDVVLPINKIRRQKKGYAVSLIKAGMEIVGLPVSNTVRPPVIPVELEHYKQLEKILESTFNKYPLDSKVY